MPLGAKALQRLPIRGHVSGPRHVRCANVSFISVDIISQSDVIFFLLRSAQQFGSNQTFPVVSW